MPDPDRRQFILDLYRHLLGRDPSSGEIDHWLVQLDGGLPERQVFSCLIQSIEYSSSRRVRLAFPPGHFHSPIVDPEEARRYVGDHSGVDPGQLPGLNLSLARMRHFWVANQKVLQGTGFERHAGGKTRYYYENDVYPIGDATLYRVMIHSHRPARIIEIGSGFSTAAALDSIDEARLKTTITCVEPDPERLFGLLGWRDRHRITVIKKKVQDIPLSQFARLEPNDILFVDSTHIMKTGSDVNYELFHILPALNDGVLIHFHDIHYPFEYRRAGSTS